MALTLTPLEKYPLVSPGDDIAQQIITALENMQLGIKAGDILVIAQKIISKSENRLVNLKDVVAGTQAHKIALSCDKDPRLVELILSESNAVIRTKPGTIIVEHRLGFLCANAGIDHSNVKARNGDSNEWFLLLPVDPDHSAQKIREKLEIFYKCTLGVLIIDSHGRAWRNGIVGTSIGVAGLPGLVDMRGKKDIFGYSLRITTIAAADELAAAASLMMGQAGEGIPVIHVRGFPYKLRNGSIKELIRRKEKDLFR
ncbi:MAG: coenzyme F420-0:L-glutamate ligase [Anaerolineaceae bacterium]|nr:coenzyme F420-0:L-glutamate ligase [Anaerolineaceae bacterium]